MDRQVRHTIYCAERGVTPALTNGALLTLLNGASGAPVSALPTMGIYNVAFIYAYFVMQCPLEAIHGRQSLLHNMIAGGALGYAGAQTGRLGLFGLETALLVNRIPLPVGGALIYGTMAGLLGALGGKRI